MVECLKCLAVTTYLPHSAHPRDHNESACTRRRSVCCAYKYTPQFRCASHVTRDDYNIEPLFAPSPPRCRHVGTCTSETSRARPTRHGYTGNCRAGGRVGDGRVPHNTSATCTNTERDGGDDVCMRFAPNYHLDPLWARVSCKQIYVYVHETKHIQDLFHWSTSTALFYSVPRDHVIRESGNPSAVRLFEKI